MGIFKGYLLVSDMDGTLINNNKEISKENIDAINYFINEGGCFTIATGRMIPSAMEYLPLVKINAPCILHNGGVVFDYENNKYIRRTFIEEHRKEIIKRIKKDYPNLGIEIFSNEIIYIYNSCVHTERYLKHNFNVVYNVKDDVFNMEWTKILIVGNKDEINELEKVYSNKYDSGTCCRSGERFFDIVANGVSKSEGIEYIASVMNINKNNIVTVGDSMNDIEMLRDFKHSFYIKGGDTRLYNVGKHKAPNCNENPIKFIVEYIEKEVIKKA